MTRTLRNAIVWAAVLAICLVLYLFTARVNLHFVDPLRFLVYCALAAAALAALLWWEIASDKDADRNPPSL